MDQPDFSTTALEDLRQLALSRSAFSAHAMREMTRRAYDLPADAPARSPPEVPAEGRALPVYPDS